MSPIGKIIYLLKADIFIYKIAKKFKPDLLLSFGSPYLAQVSVLIRKPHIIFDDTEHAKFSHRLTYPFTDVVITPNCYSKEIGRKQLRFAGYMELCYLQSNYYKSNSEIFNLLNLQDNEPYIYFAICFMVCLP